NVDFAARREARYLTGRRDLDRRARRELLPDLANGILPLRRQLRHLWQLWFAGDGRGAVRVVLLVLGVLFLLLFLFLLLLRRRGDRRTQARPGSARHLRLVTNALDLLLAFL